MQQISLGLMVGVASVLLSSWTTAGKLGIGTVGFSNVSARASAAQTIDRQTTRDSAYYFTVVLPEHATGKFAKLSFTELRRTQGAAPIQFDLPNTSAFIGTPEAIGSAIQTQAWIDETGTFWVEFNPPISSGTTLTVAFRTQRLPSGKAYEYGAAAYPATAHPVPVFVGNGTLTNP